MIRSIRKNRFTQISNVPLRDATLSLQAKGLLTLMISFPENWEYHMSHLVSQSSNGRDATQTAMNELTEAGYILKRAKGGADAGGWDWFVSDDKADIAELLEIRRTENPKDGKSASSNTDSTKTEKETKIVASLFEDQKTSEEGRDRRQKYAIDASVQETARKRLKDLLGDRYKYAQALMNKHGYKAETIHLRLSGNPSLLAAFEQLTDDMFTEVLSLAVQQAGQHSSGWQAMTGPQFMSVLESKARKPAPTQQKQSEVDRLAGEIKHTLSQSPAIPQYNWTNPVAATLMAMNIRRNVNAIVKEAPEHPALVWLENFRFTHPTHPLFSHPDYVQEEQDDYTDDGRRTP
jgi:hypothetical protein